MTPGNAIKKLWDLGYFFSPEALEVDLAAEADLPLLLPKDAVVIAAAKAYQRVFGNEYDEINLRKHQTIKPPDGKIDNSMFSLLEIPRCGQPDFISPLNAVEQARFGDDCLGKITTSHNMSLTGVTKEEIDKAFKRAGQNWSDVIKVRFELRDGEYPNTNIFAQRASLGGNILADQILNVGGCSQKLRNRYNGSVNWYYDYIVAVITHEWGHALGWGHITNDRSAIMYPSIHSEGVKRGGTPNASDIAVMVQLGYIKGSYEGPGDEPPDEPTDNTIVIGTITLDRDLKKGQKLSLVINSKPNGGWEI